MRVRATSFVLSALAVLVALSVDPLLLIEFVVGPILVGLVIAELDREGGWLAVRIVSFATLLLPHDSREEREDEWVDHVLAAGEEGLRPLFTALGIALLAAPHLAFSERWSVIAGGEPLERLLDGLRRLREVEAFPSLGHLEDITEIQLLRMSDTELVEIQHAVRTAKRRRQNVPQALILAMASLNMSHRMHQMRGRNVARRHPLVRLLARLKYHMARARPRSAREAARALLKP